MSKRKACDDVSSSPKVATLSESPLLDLPPEIWGMISDYLHPLYRTAARVACRHFRSVIKMPTKEDIRVWHCVRCASISMWNEWISESLIGSGHKYVAFCTMVDGAAGGHIAVLEWFRKRGYHIDQNASVRAAKGGHLKTLEWLVANGYALEVPGYRCTDNAASIGRTDILDFLKANGCKFYESSCTRLAIEGNHLNVLGWLKANGSRFGQNQFETFRLALSTGSADALRWLLENGYPAYKHLLNETCVQKKCCRKRSFGNTQNNSGGRIFHPASYILCCSQTRSSQCHAVARTTLCA